MPLASLASLLLQCKPKVDSFFGPCYYGRMNPEPDNQDKDETPAIDVETILAIHRDPDGYISFVRKPDPAAPPRLDKKGKPYTFETLFSIRASKLRDMFPEIVDFITHDSYFSVNAFYKPAPWPNKLTGLPDAWRKENNLSRLAACYSDIDCGRADSDEPGAALDWRQAQHEAEALADSGMIPQPSIMARSGRGVYLFWFLRDEKDPKKLPKAWPEKIERYKAINRALNERLRTHQLPADPAAIDAARVLRVPGSIHRKAQRSVYYVIQLDIHGKGFVYTLPELADFLHLPALDGELPEKTRALAKPSKYRRVKEKGKAPGRAAGAKSLNAKRAQDLLLIQAWRGGFIKRGMKYPDGHNSCGRRFMLTLYANFLRGSGENQETAAQALHSMAENMRPPYPSDPLPDDQPIEEIIQAEYSTKSRRRYANKTLCKLLGITETAILENELNNLQTIMPESMERERAQALPSQSDLIQERRDFALWYIQKNGIISARKLADIYKLHRFPGANHETANQDLNALGFKQVRPRGGRPRKA
jgi:hypothetical protein